MARTITLGPTKDYPEYRVRLVRRVEEGRRYDEVHLKVQNRFEYAGTVERNQAKRWVGHGLCRNLAGFASSQLEAVRKVASHHITIWVRGRA